MPVTFVSLPHRLTLILQIIGFSLMSTGKFTLLLKISLTVETFHSLIQCFFFFFLFECFYFCDKKWHHGIDRDSAESLGSFGKNRDFKNIIQTIHEHGMCLISLFLNGPFDILKFPMSRSSTSCSKFILRHYILFLYYWVNVFINFTFRYFTLVRLTILTGIKILVVYGYNEI